MNLIYVNRTAGDLIQHGTRLKKPKAILEHQRDRKTYARMFPEIEPVWEMNFGAFRYHGIGHILVAIWTPGGPKALPKCTKKTQNEPKEYLEKQSGTRRHPKGAKNELKADKREPEGSQGEPKGNQKGGKGRLNASPKIL